MARKLVGMVTSDVQDKTLTVAVSRSVTHPVYGKRYSVTKKFAVHDPENSAHKGDKVEISETRPISKNKSWQLSKIIEAGHSEVVIKSEELVVDVESKRRKEKKSEDTTSQTQPKEAKE